MGKGSARRPSQVSEQQIAENWIRVFGEIIRQGPSSKAQHALREGLRREVVEWRNFPPAPNE